MRLCLFCSARTQVNDEYHDAARELGALIAERGHELYYGGGSIGLMGTAARAVHEHGGRVVGVIPSRLRSREVAYEKADDLIVTDSMSDRKSILIRESDAFVVLPGGFGTLDELLDTVTMRHLGYHEKPIAIVNTRGYFDRLAAMFEFVASEGFARSTQLDHYKLVNSPSEAIDYLESGLQSP
jgi:uncharacterized protein (TIGR00730 family)